MTAPNKIKKGFSSVSEDVWKAWVRKEREAVREWQQSWESVYQNDSANENPNNHSEQRSIFINVKNAFEASSSMREARSV